MAKRDYYEVLGVSQNAEADAIKKAYRKLARELHPDVNKATDAEARFKEVKEAYDVLSDDQKRAQYDQFGHADPMGGSGAGPSGFGDSVNDIFDMFFGGGGRRNPNAPQKGEDLEMRLNIEFKDAFFGFEKQIEIDREETCDTCDGTGAKPGTKPEVCHVCKGSGQQEVIQNTPFGRIATRRTCGTCGGTGKIIKQRCNQCWGTGKVKKKRKLDVKIPAGIQSGSQLRMSGEGEKGLRGGPAGDLYVTVQVKGHEFFTREQDDVHCRVPLTFVQATLGDEIEVPTMNGRVMLKVPPGTQSETTFRLKGKGFPHLRSNGRQQGQGDQHVRVFVVVPTKVTDAQKDLLRAFAGEEVEGDNSNFFERMKRAIMGDS